MVAIPFYKSVYGTHFLAGDSWRSRSKDYQAMAGATVSYLLKTTSQPIFFIAVYVIFVSGCLINLLLPIYSFKLECYFQFELSLF